MSEGSVLPEQKNKKNPKKKKKQPVFGVRLRDLDDIPEFVKEGIKFLEEQGALEEEGIFRISGDNNFMQQTKASLNKGKKLQFSQVKNIHSISGLIKMYFRELPEPLLTFECYDMFIAAEGVPDPEPRLAKIKTVLKFLPPLNLMLLKTLCEFLWKIACKQDVNKMSPGNLAIVFAPNLLKHADQNNLEIMFADSRHANGLMQTLIEKYPDIFEKDPEVAKLIDKIVHPEKYQKSASSNSSNKTMEMGKSGDGIPIPQPKALPLPIPQPKAVPLPTPPSPITQQQPTPFAAQSALPLPPTPPPPISAANKPVFPPPKLQTPAASRPLPSTPDQPKPFPDRQGRHPKPSIVAQRQQLFGQQQQTVVDNGEKIHAPRRAAIAPSPITPMNLIPPRSDNNNNNTSEFALKFEQMKSRKMPQQPIPDLPKDESNSLGSHSNKPSREIPKVPKKDKFVKIEGEQAPNLPLVTSNQQSQPQQQQQQQNSTSPLPLHPQQTFAKPTLPQRRAAHFAMVKADAVQDLMAQIQTVEENHQTPPIPPKPPVSAKKTPPVPSTLKPKIPPPPPSKLSRVGSEDDN